MSSFHRGVVTNNNDPARRGRVRLKIPHILGDVETGWARPMSSSPPPQVHDRVWVTFESGEDDRPVFLPMVLGGSPGPEILARLEDLENRVRAMEVSATTIETSFSLSPGSVSLVSSDMSVTPSPSVFSSISESVSLYTDTSINHTRTVTDGIGVVDDDETYRVDYGVTVEDSVGLGDDASHVKDTNTFTSGSELITFTVPGDFMSTVKSIPGLTHYYPLNSTFQGSDQQGSLDGSSIGGVSYGTNGATFDGTNYVEIADNNDFSLVTTGELTILVFQTVLDWTGVQNANGYVHWMGKGDANEHEWVFRHYPADHIDRPKRTSTYLFNSTGGLGAGSYFQDDDAVGVERVIVARYDNYTSSGFPNTSSTYPGLIQLFKNGVLRDSDGMHNYAIATSNGISPVRVGTRELDSFLKGRVRRLAFFNRKLTDTEISYIYNARTLPET